VCRADEHGLWVAATDGTVAVLECQRPGKQILPAAEFLRGLHAPLVGERWSSPAAAERP
jgi:methionyl-tRNA formyltransferase